MFDYDLDTSLLKALGLNIPPQKTYEMKPDSVGFMIYDDYIGRQITESGYANGGKINFYFGQKPNNGKYCLYWTGSGQYGAVGFDFTPDRDLSALVSKNYALSFLVRGNTPGTKIEVRFTDTKTTAANDHPWRMNYTVTESLAAWDGRWHKVYIPLNNFIDQGSYDNGTWYNPVGAFDWTAVDKFEIVTDQASLENKTFCFDNIAIANMDTARIYETSTLIFVSGLTVTSESGSYAIANAAGSLQMLSITIPSNATIPGVKWTVNDSSLADIGTQGLLTAKRNGTVLVTATSTDGAGIKGTASVTISGQSNAIQEAQRENRVQLYPVPAENGMLTVKQTMGSPVILAIYNANGKLVLQKESGETVIQVNVSSLPQGLYFLKVSNGFQNVTKKLVIK